MGNPAIPMPTRQRLKLTQSAGAHRLCLWAFAEDEARSIDQHSPFGRLAGGGCGEEAGLTDYFPSK